MRSQALRTGPFALQVPRPTGRWRRTTEEIEIAPAANVGTRFAGLLRSRFVRGVGVLAGGAVLAQGLNTLVFFLVLTRLYTTEQFGILQVYMPVLAILLMVVSLRYEVAIPLADTENEAVHLVALSLLLTVTTSLLSAAVILVAGSTLSRHIGGGHLGPYLLLLPVGLLGGGFYQALSYWAVRQRWFPLIAMTKVQQVVGALSIQTLMGVLGRIGILHTGPLGLLLGSVANQAMGFGSFARRGHLITRMREAGVQMPKLRAAAKRHRKIALGTSASGFINNLGLQLPFLLMAALYSLNSNGCLALSSRIVTAGGELIGNTVGQTFFGEAAARYRQDPAELKRLFVKAVRSLLIINTTVAALVWAFAPMVVTHFLPVHWAEAGTFARYQSLVLLGSLTCSPVSTTIFILKKVHLQVMWDICRVGIVAGSFYGAHMLHQNAAFAVALYSVGSLIAYAVWIAILYVLVSRAAVPATE